MTSALVKTLAAASLASLAAMATAGCYRDRSDVQPSGQTNMQPAPATTLYVMPLDPSPNNATTPPSPAAPSATTTPGMGPGAEPTYDTDKSGGSGTRGEDDRHRGEGGDKSLDKKDMDKAPSPSPRH